MRKRLYNSLVVLAVLAASGIASMAGQGVQGRLPDLAWTREYAVPYTTTIETSVRPKVQRQLSQEPRLFPALRIAFPQQQWIWKDHGRFWSVPDLVHTFLATVGAGHVAWLDDDRYVSEEGCVPHDCFDRGLLWIDTAPTSPTLMFSLTQIAPSEQPDGTHIWVFTSRKKIENPLPTAFQRSARRWYSANRAEGYKENVLLVTVVTPDGEQHDISFEDMMGKAAGATQ